MGNPAGYNHPDSLYSSAMTQTSTGNNNQVWTIARLLEWTQGHFEAKGLYEPRLAAEILLATALSCKRIELYTRFDQVPEPPQLDIFRDFVKRAAEHAPIAHLVGTKEFFSLEFEVSPAVLIPRPETELVVEKAIDYVRKELDESSQVEFLDMGTGSGCIAIAILKYLPDAKAVGTDISAEALEIAGRNTEKHGVSDRLVLVEADGLDLPGDNIPEDGFDLIVSNPPYVRAEEMGGLDANVRDYEPAGALTDGGDGLAFYRLLASEKSAKLLKPGGMLFAEIGEDQAADVCAIFAGEGHFEHICTYRDLTGPHDRVVQFRLLES